MRENLLFTGIRETETPDKNCEDVLREFIHTELTINAANIEFERVHMIGRKDNQYGPSRPRPIVARFSRYKQREAIRHAAPRELKGKPFGINEQYPKCVAERRKRLLPAFGKARQNPMKRSSLVAAKLFIDERQLSESEAIEYAENRRDAPHRTQPGPSDSDQRFTNAREQRAQQNINTADHAHREVSTNNRFSALTNRDEYIVNA